MEEWICFGLRFRRDIMWVRVGMSHSSRKLNNCSFTCRHQRGQSSTAHGLHSDVSSERLHVLKTLQVHKQWHQTGPNVQMHELTGPSSHSDLYTCPRDHSSLASGPRWEGGPACSLSQVILCWQDVGLLLALYPKEYNQHHWASRDCTERTVSKQSAWMILEIRIQPCAGGSGLRPHALSGTSFWRCG